MSDNALSEEEGGNPAPPSGGGFGMPAALFVLLAAITLPLVLAAPKAPTAISIAAAVLLMAAMAWQRTAPALPSPRLTGLLIAVVAWAAVSAAWAPEAGQALLASAKLAGGFAIGLLLIGAARGIDGKAKPVFVWTLAAATGLTIAFLTVEAFFAAPLSPMVIPHAMPAGDHAGILRQYGAFWLSPALSVAALMVWPLIAAPFLPVALAAMAGLVAAAAAGVGIGFAAAPLALLLGAGAAGIVWLLGRRGGQILAALAIAYVMIAPLAPHTVLKPEAWSVRESMPLQLLPRLHIWSFAAERIAEHPLRGWGMDASRDVPGGKERIFDENRQHRFGELMPLHPHNGALQVWLELGLPGAFLLAALFALTLRQGAALADRHGRRAAAAATGLTVTAAGLLSVSFGIWQNWWLASIFLAAAFFALVLNRSQPG